MKSAWIEPETMERNESPRPRGLRSCATLVVLWLCGCAGASQRVPVNLDWSEQQSRTNAEFFADAPSAIVEKCTRAIQTIQASSSDMSDDVALLSGLRHGQIPPAVWPRCAGHLLKTLEKSPRAADFLDRMGYAYQQLLRNDALEGSRRLQAELQALHQVVLSRPSGLLPRASVMDELLDDLRQAVQKQHLGSFAARHGEDLLLEFDLARGRFGGQPLDAQLLDTLLGQKKEALLQRIIARASDQALRDEARRRVVRLRIAASEWPEVTAHAAEVEAAVLKQGHFAVHLADHPFVRGQIFADRTAVQAILLKQDLWQQTISLFPAAMVGDKMSTLPAFNLRAALSLELRDLSHPVSLCAAAAELDVTPCLPPAEIHIREPIATLDSDGGVHFAQQTPIATAVDWLRQQSDLSFSVEVGGRALMGLHWPVSCSLPESLDFTAKAGVPGPDLDVRVEAINPQQILLTITGNGKSHLALVDREQALQFSVVSHGGDGKSGERGASGLSGHTGEPGAPGGAIEVQVFCDSEACGGLPYLARKMVDSQGGSGGAGGAAGDAVRVSTGGGGGGGRGRGQRGGQFQQGKRGARGAFGSPGRVNLVIVKSH